MEKFKLVLLSQFSNSLIRHFPSHQPSYACTPNICVSSTLSYSPSPHLLIFFYSSPTFPPFPTLLLLPFSVILLLPNSFPYPLPSPTCLPPSSAIPNPYSHIHLFLWPLHISLQLPCSWPCPYTSNTCPINLYFKQFVAALGGKCEKDRNVALMKLKK